MIRLATVDRVHTTIITPAEHVYFSNEEESDRHSAPACAAIGRTTRRGSIASGVDTLTHYCSSYRVGKYDVALRWKNTASPTADDIVIDSWPPMQLSHSTNDKPGVDCRSQESQTTSSTRYRHIIGTCSAAKSCRKNQILKHATPLPDVNSC